MWMCKKKCPSKRGLMVAGAFWRRGEKLLAIPAVWKKVPLYYMHGLEKKEMRGIGGQSRRIGNMGDCP